MESSFHRERMNHKETTYSYNVKLLSDLSTHLSIQYLFFKNHSKAVVVLLENKR